ncbi:AH receptor-interacting protein [Phlebotomus papatasi]|uniref:AH receptor-interacting protein n=1 Tax=Phlebotomus papatasi TaxID=29031 RepID=UPI002483E0EA|nr:AH receptor-interacting protein [Phlebotomus papatasi]
MDEALIKKECLHPGNAFVQMTPGTRVNFHYQTKRCSDGKVLDDSRKDKKPMELVLGKQFKLEVWEVIVQKMAVNEVAKFTVDKSLVPQYPFIAKTIRDARQPAEKRKHCCGMTLQNEGLGYEDLDELFKNPCDLEFTFELLSVELPENYEKESWQLSEDEKVKSVAVLREKGNQHFKDGNLDQAMSSYTQALGMLEQLMLREKPEDEEWMELFGMKKPLLLNYSQCKLTAKDFYSAIEHCTEVLKYDPDNVKALYRRAKGHLGAWNLDKAKEDFKRAAELDPSLKAAVTKELKHIDELQKSKDDADKERYKNLFH